MSDLFFPDEPELPKLDKHERDDWKQMVGKTYWAQFERAPKRRQDTLFHFGVIQSGKKNGRSIFWKPPVPIHHHAFVDDDLNSIVKVHKDGRITLGGKIVRDKHVKLFWNRITLFIGYDERVRAAFQYKDLHKDCARMVCFYEERYPGDIPDILAGLKMTKYGPNVNPSVPQDGDDGKAPF